MARHPVLPDVGQIIEVTRGRDRGLIAVVVGQEADRFVRIADGDKRKVENAKKKNAIHVRVAVQSSRDEMESFRQEKVTNARLRHVLRKYCDSQDAVVDGSEEGGTPNGQG